MTVQSVKKKIKEKFGSYSDFAEVAGIDRYVFQRDFLTANRVERDDIKKYDKLCEELKPQPDIHPKKLRALKKAIDDAGGVVAVCKENAQFSRDSIFQILAGRRKRMTPKVKELFEFFEIDSE